MVYPIVFALQIVTPIIPQFITKKAYVFQFKLKLYN